MIGTDIALRHKTWIQAERVTCDQFVWHRHFAKLRARRGVKPPPSHGIAHRPHVELADRIGAKSRGRVGQSALVGLHASHGQQRRDADQADHHHADREQHFEQADAGASATRIAASRSARARQPAETSCWQQVPHHRPPFWTEDRASSRAALIRCRRNQGRRKRAVANERRVRIVGRNDRTRPIGNGDPQADWIGQIGRIGSPDARRKRIDHSRLAADQQVDGSRRRFGPVAHVHVVNSSAGCKHDDYR